MKTKKIYCCECNKDVNARSTTGEKIYPHLESLKSKKFFICDTCKQYIGCHPSSGKPLGAIPTKEFREIRIKIHNLIDPLWQRKKITRGKLYGLMTKKMKLNNGYHTAVLKTKEEHFLALKVATEIADYYNENEKITFSKKDAINLVSEFNKLAVKLH